MKSISSKFDLYGKNNNFLQKKCNNYNNLIYDEDLTFNLHLHISEIIKYGLFCTFDAI